MTSTPSFLTPRQVAERLGLPVKAVYGRLERGTLPGYKDGGAWKIVPSELDAWTAPKAAPMPCGPVALPVMERAPSTALGFLAEAERHQLLADGFRALAGIVKSLAGQSANVA
jgi:excisionase family DNA binding protein